MWPEVADPQSIMAKEVNRLLDYYSERQDSRLGTVNAPMWIASQAAANTELLRTDLESQQSAMRLFPSLAVLDSPLNKLFRETYVRYKDVKPQYFLDPRWPIKLARQCALQLDAHIAAKGGQMTQTGLTTPSEQNAAPVTSLEAPNSPVRHWVMPTALLILGLGVGYGVMHHARRMHRAHPDEHDGSSI